MASDSSLTCNFTITTDLGVGVSFRSADGGASYGGLITIFTPGTAGPVTTGLWDDDGNVFFTIYDSETPSLSCTINSGSTPGTWDPYVTVAEESGLACAIEGPQQTGENSYAYTLVISAGDAGSDEIPDKEEIMATDYTFSVSLLNASPDPNELQVWQSGTLTLDTASATSVTGALTLPGYYNEPIPFTGSTAPPDTMAGTIVVASGQSSEAEITVTIVYNYDGFLYDGSYLGGQVSMLDYSAQETYLYVIQGFSPQGPFGATFRGSAEAAPRE